MHHRRITITVGFSLLFCAQALTGVRSQERLATPLLRASASSELPLPAWGPYARGHIGPCCLVNRLLLQQFAFPVIISQQRDETMSEATRAADGSVRVRQQAVTLLRRGAGLAPLQSAADDSVTSQAARPLNRQALLTEADRDGLLWRAQLAFEPAAVSQPIAQLPDASGKLVPPREWGAGDASVRYFPAFAEPAGDGLLIRVSITNRSAAPQTYCVDLLGGMDTQTEGFLPQDLILQPDAQGEGIVIQHPKCAPVFALSASVLPTPLRAYTVTDAYFGSSAATAKRAQNGALLPYGATSTPLDETAKPRGKRKPAAAENAAPHAAADGAPWGLIRISDIAVAPGQTLAFFLAVGIGQDAEAARSSAQTLLGIAEDAMPNGKLREGAFTLAQRAHQAAMFAPEDASIARLMAQALGNVPLIGGRRLGVPSRQATQGRLPGLYQATLGGMIALAYTANQPVYAAAELNQWFHTTGNPDAALQNPTPFPPTNLLALWELLQTTKDHALLLRCYPFARRRYLEFLAAGRKQDTDWLFGWPMDLPGDLLIPSMALPVPGDDKTLRIAAPDYSAYVIRSACLLKALAVQAERPATEVAEYTRDIQQASQALNDRLWKADAALYVPAAPLSPDTVADMLPLIAGREGVPSERRTLLLKALTDPTTFWSPYGIRQVSKRSAGYRPDDGQRGAVRYGINWLIWKGLIDQGETEIAAKLASNVLRGYRVAQQASGGCPEWLNADTGAPGGVLDYSGDAGGLISLYAAYHMPGAATGGWNVQWLDQRFNAQERAMHLAFRNLEPTAPAAFICALGVPHGRYRVTGSITDSVTADDDGVVTLHAPADGSTQSVDIVAIPGSAP